MQYEHLHLIRCCAVCCPLLLNRMSVFYVCDFLFLSSQTKTFKPYHVEVSLLPCTKLQASLSLIPLHLFRLPLDQLFLTKGVSLAMIETFGLISSHAHGTIKKRHQLMNKQQQQIDGRRKTERGEKITQARG